MLNSYISVPCKDDQTGEITYKKITIQEYLHHQALMSSLDATNLDEKTTSQACYTTEEQQDHQ